MNIDEYKKRVGPDLANIAPEAMKRFLDSLDDCPDKAEDNMQEAISTINENTSSIELTSITVVPNFTPKTVAGHLREVAFSYVRQNPNEDSDDIAAQLSPIAESNEVKDQLRNIENAVVMAGTTHLANPLPFQKAISALTTLRNEIDHRKVSRDPIAEMPLVADLLQIDTAIHMKRPIRLKNGKTTTLTIDCDTPLFSEKVKMLNALSSFILANAALAKDIASGSLSTWKRIIDTLWRQVHTNANNEFSVNATSKPWKKSIVRQFFDLVEDARSELFSDAIIINYIANRRKQP